MNKYREVANIYCAFGRANKRVQYKTLTPSQEEKRRLRLLSAARRRVSLAALMLCAMLLLGIGPEGSTLVFVDETPLELSLTKLQEGANLGICNVGQNPLVNVVGQLEGFAPPLDEGMTVTGVGSEPLNPGECRSVSLKHNKDSALGVGTYRGVVMLSADNVDPVTRQVIVKVESSAAAKPVRVTKWLPSNITRWWPLEKEVELPLRSKDEAALEVKKGDTLGVLSGGFGDGYAKVVAAENFEGKLGSGLVHPLTVRVEGIEGVGTYSGTLTIAGGDFDVAMFISDTLLWALFFLLVGLALAGLALLIARRIVPSRRLRGRCEELNTNYVGAIEDFQKALPARKTMLIKAKMDEQEADRIISNLWKYAIDDDSIKAYQERFGWFLGDYMKGNIFFDPAAEDYKQLLTMLENAESDVRHLREPEGLGKSLQDLALALYRLDKYLRVELRLDPQLWPALVKPAAAKLTGGNLKVGAAKKISEQAKEFTTLIDDWRKSLKQILRYYIWAAELEKRLKRENIFQQWHDRKALRTATSKILEALNELLDAESAADLKEMGTSEDLKGAYNTLSALGGKYSVWLVIVEPDSEEERFRDANKAFAESKDLTELTADILRQPFDEEPPPRIAKLVEDATFKSPSPRPQPVNIRRRRFSPIATAILGVSLALLIALIATFVAQVYPESDKAFGTTKDYLAAVAAGATGATIASFLQGPLSSILTRLRPGA